MRFALWWLVPALLVAFWLGARGLDADPMWADEYHSVYDAGGSIYGPISLADIWNRIEQRNPWHAPGYFFLLSGWGRLVGWDPAALRALSLLVGMIAIALIYRIGRDYLNARVGLVAAVIVATSALFIHYAHEQRMYTLLLVWMLVMVWAYLRIVRPGYRPRIWEWALLLVSTVALLYTHFFAALPLAPLGIYHLIAVRKDRKWLQVTGIFLLAGILFLPWADVLRAGIRETTEDEELHAIALDAPQAIARLVDLLGNQSVIGIAVALIAVSTGVIVTLRRDQMGARTMLIFALVMLVALLAVNAMLHLLSAGRGRYLLLLVPFVALLAGTGLMMLARWRPAGVIVSIGLLVIWGVTGVSASLNRSVTNTLDGSGYLFPLHQVARALKTQLQSDDFVLSYLPSRGNPPHSYERMAPVYFAGMDVEYAFQQLSGNTVTPVGDREHFWLAYMPGEDMDIITQVRAAFEPEYHVCKTPVERPDLILALYTRSEVCCQPEVTARPALAQFGGITLVGVAPLPDQASQSLDILAGWLQDSTVPPYTYSVALHVLDDAGELAAQADYGLPPTLFSCVAQTISLDGLTPGAYTVQAGVYAWETGQPVGTMLSLGAIEVRP